MKKMKIFKWELSYILLNPPPLEKVRTCVFWQFLQAGIMAFGNIGIFSDFFLNFSIEQTQKKKKRFKSRKFFRAISPFSYKRVKDAILKKKFNTLTI